MLVRFDLPSRLLALGLAVVPLLCCDRAVETSASFEPSPAQPPAPSARDEGLPWWRSVVFYEVFVRSFADSDRGPLAGDGIGDLQGLIERLDYLNDGDPDTHDDLEVGGLWLMPVMQSPSYHGYDVVDYRAVERDYGTNEDFRRLIDEAHRRGIRVIVDLVLNHTSNRHRWFRNAWRRRSTYNDWYIWSVEPKEHLGPWGQPVWHEVPWWQRGWRYFNHLSYYGIFWAGMPDLNYRSPEVTRAMFDVSRFWLEQMGADGFRLDAVRHLVEDGRIQEDTPETHAWLRRYRAHLREVAPEALMVGEVWADTDAVASYGPDELDLTFQFELARSTLEAVRQGTATELTGVAQRVRDAFAGRGYATFLTNHDQVRVQSDLDGDREKARLAATLLLAGPGVPFIYYGEEIGMTGLKPDPHLRRPMQWQAGPRVGFSTGKPWQDPALDADLVNVDRQNGDPESLLSHYRRLIRLRNRQPALRAGDFTILATGNPAVYAFRRRSGEHQIVVLANLSAGPVREYSLKSSDLGPLDGQSPLEILRGESVDAPVRETWSPVAELAPQTAYLFQWTTLDID